MPSKRQIIDRELYAYFVTFSVYRRRRLFSHDQPKRLLLGVLNAELTEHETRCVSFVIMPNHVHAILWFPKPHEISRFMHAWKRKSSFHIRNCTANMRSTILRSLAKAFDSGNRSTTRLKSTPQRSSKKN
jgi:REP element-mobilizing transposase RayT